MTTAYLPAQEMPSAESQGRVAGTDRHPVALFVSASKDLVTKIGSSFDSWFLTSHLETRRGQLNMLIHYMRLTDPHSGPEQIAVIAALLDVRAGRFVSEEQDFPEDQCSVSADRCKVVTPIGGMTGRSAYAATLSPRKV